ncbi:hypothetical protein GCM10009105_07040 [Dokdonella soli]|uniref:Uncharacterized protein n=1 Tax=Dokdonella soli TaxID=529810 RepID=A0ABN1ID31_9GAMM
MDTMPLPLPDDVRTALAAAKRAPGWNSRSGAIRRFELGPCVLYVVPARCWAYRLSSLPFDRDYDRARSQRV